VAQETLPPTTSPPRPPAAAAGRGLALALATLGFAVNFWAWSLLSPLAPRYQELLGLSPLAVSVMVAVPVIVGSLGRIPLGALTDRYGGRIVFAVLSFAVIVPVLFLAFATSYPALLAGGLLLGLGGASFAVGVPFVNAWFPPERRGFALGVYGMGNIGTAVSGFVSPRVASAIGRPWAFLIVAVGLAAVGLAFLVAGRDAPNRPRATEPFLTRFRAAARLPIARDLAVLYAITFGGFVAFGVYLPTFLKTVYGLGPPTRRPGRPASWSWRPWRARSAAGWPTGSPASRCSGGRWRWSRWAPSSPPSSPTSSPPPSRSWPSRPRWGSATARCSRWSAPASPPPPSAASPGWSARPAGSAASCPRSSWAWSTRPPATTRSG
jgi:NNP family nitrate/nitrite transporter-like MFS transporter